MAYPELIEEFCITELDTLYHSVRTRRSVLLEIQKDMDFNFGIYKTFKEIGITQEQLNALEPLTPIIVVPLLLFSAIDMMARVKYKGQPPRGMNRVWFIESAIQFFDVTPADAAELWVFRNSLTHSYSLNDYVLSRSGTGASSPIFEIQSSGTKVVFVRAMRGSLQEASRTLKEYLLNESPAEQARTIEYLDNHGFTYSLAV